MSRDKSSILALEIDNIATTVGYSQVINKLTHFANETSTSNLSFITNYGMEQSVLEKCYHSFTYGTLDLNLPLHLPCYRDIWDYKNADTDLKFLLAQKI